MPGQPSLSSTRVSTRVPNEHVPQLQTAAEVAGCTVSALIARIVAEHLPRLAR